MELEGGGLRQARVMPRLPLNRQEQESPQQRLERITQRQKNLGGVGFLNEYFENREPLELPPPDARVSEMCRKAKQDGRKVLVLDSFWDTSTESERVDEAHDYNGDLRPDQVMHGDLVQTYLEKEGIRTEAYQCNPEFVSRCLHDIANKVEAGVMEKPAFLNISLGSTVKESELQAVTGVEDLTFENAASHRDEAIEGMRRNLANGLRRNEMLSTVSYQPGTPEAVQHEVVQALQQDFNSGLASSLLTYASVERLSRAGVPTVWSAGNDTPEHINLESLSDSISVGALEPDGTKSSYSADNSLVTHWRQGTYPVRQVEGGLDINADQKADLPEERLSDGPSYQGRSVNEPGVISQVPDEVRERAREIQGVLRQYRQEMTEEFWTQNVLPDFYRRGLKPDKLYPARDIMALRDESILPEVEPFYRNAYSTPDQKYTFFANHEGRLHSRIEGTSFAAPSICSEDNTTLVTPDQKPLENIENGFRLRIDG